MKNTQLELARRFLEQTAVNLFLTGRAGTGKTTFLRHLRQQSPKRMIVVAPTGVAAINAGGVTIHSFFQLAFAPYVPESERGTRPERKQDMFRFNKQKVNIIKSIDLLVIDEISMVRADVLDAVSDVLCRYRDPKKPFGGVQLLMIGDLQQLAPVIRDEEWRLLGQFYASPFFFESKALKQTVYTCIELQHIYRQSDDRFIEILNGVRDNTITREMLEELNRRCLSDVDAAEREGYITLTSHNHTAHAINEARLAKLATPAFSYDATLDGVFPEYLYPTDASLTLKVGAQVMFMKNDLSPQKRYYNGKIGTVTALDDEGVEVLPYGEHEPIEVEPAEWTNTRYKIDPQTKDISEEIEGRFLQYPLKTAWAITIHKSQGLTFEHAVIDAADSFSHGQVYVALSRCKTLEGLILSAPLDLRCMINDTKVRSFCDYATTHQPDEAALEQQRKIYYRALISDLFDFDAMERRLKALWRFTDEHLKKLYPKLAVLWQEKITLFSTEICDVSRRFQQQIHRLIDENLDYLTNSMLCERVDKGRSYFLEQSEKIIAPVLVACDVELDNKTLQKELKNLLGTANQEFGVKKATLEACTGGFDIHRYLETRAKAILDHGGSSDSSKRSGRSEPTGTVSEKEAKVTLTDDMLHPELFETLRVWRKAQADQAGVPGYMVMTQKALLGVSNLLPSSVKELSRIKGIGPKFLASYGEEVLDRVRRFRVASGTDISFDALVPSAVSLPSKRTAEEKSPRVDTRTLTLTLLEQGLSRQEVAVERQLNPSTIDGHITDLIRQGILQADQFVPADKIAIITHYLRTHPNEKFALMQETLGSDFSYAEICFVRGMLARDKA